MPRPDMTPISTPIRRSTFRRFAALVVLPLVAALVVVPSAAQAAGTQDERPYEPPTEQCTILGTPGDDRLTGTPGDDVICGLGGKDVLIGLGGNDDLYGGEGDDRLYGRAGDDLLVGGPGADIVRGGPGDDTMEGPGESSPDGDSLEGEAGTDTIVDSDVNELLFHLYVRLQLDYRFPRGTKIEWFFNYDSGASNCVIDRAPNWTDTITYSTVIRDAPLFAVPTASDSFSCQFEKSYATWQVRVTTPDKKVSTGSVFVSAQSSYAIATCHDWKQQECSYAEWVGKYGDGEAVMRLTFGMDF